MENVAMCDEGLLEAFLEHGAIEEREIGAAIAERKIFPCYFGSALKMQGIEALLAGIEKYVQAPVYGDVYKRQDQDSAVWSAEFYSIA